MCVNDVITSGAKLFFLDYLATSKIKYDVHSKLKVLNDRVKNVT